MLNQKTGNITENSPKRYECFDFARGVAIIIMVGIHVLYLLSYNTIEQSVFYKTTYILSSFICAPVFIFLMGFFISLSRKQNSYKKIILHSLQILLIAYLLNFLRGVIPNYMGIYFESLSYTDIKPYTFGILFIEIDILHLAGLCLLILGLLYKWVKNKYILLIILMIIIGITPFLVKIQTNIPVMNYFLELLWGQSFYTYFPLFPWMAFSLSGIIYGEFFKQAKDKDRFFHIGFYSGIVIFIFGLLISVIFPEFGFDIQTLTKGDYIHGILPTSLIVCVCGVICMWLFFCQYLANTFSSSPVFKRIFFWSKNVTLFYCTQWILIGWLEIDIGQRLNIHTTVFFIFVILILTDTCIVLFNQTKKAIMQS